MTPEDELRRTATRGDRAKALLENPLFVEAFEKVEAMIHEKWVAASTPEVRERSHVAITLLPALRQAITDVVNDGTVARKKLEQAIGGKRRIF